MNATITNPTSAYCGAHGKVYPADDLLGVSKPYIFSPNDKAIEYDLAVSENDFTDGYLLLNNAVAGVGDFLREVANITKDYPRYLNALLNGYARVTTEGTYTLSRGKSS